MSESLKELQPDASPPKPAAARQFFGRQFRLRTLFLVVTLAALFLALRHWAIGAQQIAEMYFRVVVVRLVMIVAVVQCWASALPKPDRPVRRIAGGVILGGTIGSIVVLWLGLELLYRSYARFGMTITWQDLPDILHRIAVLGLVPGATLGGILTYASLLQSGWGRWLVVAAVCGPRVAEAWMCFVAAQS